MRLGPLTIQAPVLLLGLLAAAIPVVLHLLAKVRAPQMFFPTLRFLRLSMEKTARRRRVQHWLLLLLRMAALAVLAMAVAQPLFQPDNPMGGSDHETAAVVILDNSLSMQFAEGGTTRFEQAKLAVERLLAAHDFQEVGLLVTNGPPIEGGRALLNADKQRDRLKQVIAGIGRADLVGAALSAEKMLAESKLPNKEIYLFTDLQETSAKALYALADDKKAGRPALFVIAPDSAAKRQATAAPGGVTNLAVTKVELVEPGVMVGQSAAFDVTVRNFSTEGLPAKAAVDVFVDNQDRGISQEIPVINPGSAQVLRFNVNFDKPGIHSGWFGVKMQGGGHDDLPADDRRYFTVNVADRVNVLLVKSRYDLDRSEDPGFCIRRMVMARLPGDPGERFQLAEKTAADSLSPALLAGRDVVITSDLASLSLDSAASPPGNSNADPLAGLRQYVRDGGTWMIFLGPSVDLASYNAWLCQPGPDRQPAILDGRLVRYEGDATGGQSADEPTPPVIQWVDASNPMFAGFYPTLAPYRRVQVYRHAVVKLAPGSSGREIARLDNGDPLVIETTYGRGRVLLFTTAAMGRWTNWLTRAQGMALRQGMLASANRGSGGQAGSLIERGENEAVVIDAAATHLSDRGPVGLAASQPAGLGPIRVQVRLPDDAVVELKSPDGRSPVRFTGTTQLGGYLWQAFGADSDHPIAQGGFAVNVPEGEADLAAISPQRLAQLVPGRTVEVGESIDQLARQVAEHRRGSPLWPWMLAAVLVMLAIEARIANRNRPVSEAEVKLIPGVAR